MAATVITVAPALLQPGPAGPFPAASAVIFSPAGYQINFTNTADWPTASGPDDNATVAYVTVEVRIGSTWQVDGVLGMGKGPWKLNGATVNSGFWQVATPPNANGIRVSLNVLLAATLGFTVQTL